MKKLWTIADWKQAYQDGKYQLSDLITYISYLDNTHNAWISIATPEQINAQLAALPSDATSELPLYGVPFAVKDNIDVAGFYTTAACDSAKYLATEDATVVKKLKQAGAIVIGKTNLDQFATGLSGARSPFGTVKNSFNPDYISGGSSSGSSVVVAQGIVPFALGTDTAGSGRVPAAHNNLVGLKPTKGWFSSFGAVPACRTLDAISILALTVDEAWKVAQIMQGYDIKDAYSRQNPMTAPASFSKGKIAIPAHLEFYGNKESAQAFNQAIEHTKALGYQIETIDFSVFEELANTLYNGTWVAERDAALQNYTSRDQCLPVIQQVIGQADKFTATDAMRTEYLRAELQRQIQIILQDYDALLVPSAPTIYTIAEMEADPIIKNSHMGVYTNFVNLADLSALALPNGFRTDGLPIGVTFIAPAWHDLALARFGQHWQALSNLPLATSSQYYQKGELLKDDTHVLLAVVGAHLTGMPLNFQLTSRNGVLLQQTTTSPNYQLFSLNNTSPPKPGLKYTQDGISIIVEIWEIPRALFGDIVAEVPAPLGIGNLQLIDGNWVKGFICEGYALTDAKNISEYGGWRKYIQYLN